MSPEPENTPSRPPVSAAADAILASLEFPSPSEHDYIMNSYQRYLSGYARSNSAGGGTRRPIEMNSLYHLSDRHVAAILRNPQNSHFELAGRIFLDPVYVQRPDGSISAHAVLELRLRDGSPALICGNRLYKITEGLGAIHISAQSEGSGVVFRSMLSPKAYRNELALLISHCEAQRQPLHLAETSFAYRLFRAELGARYGQIASPNREVSAIRSTGTLEAPRFILTFEPTSRLTRHEFVVSTTHSDGHGSIVLQSYLYGLP